jgi:hypothetical protein
MGVPRIDNAERELLKVRFLPLAPFPFTPTREVSMTTRANPIPKEDKPYSVNLWDTHPDLEEDTCSTGEEFATLAEAVACMANLDATFNAVYFRNTPFVELDGPDIYLVVERPGVAKRARKEEAMDMAAERSEFAMQQGMGLGIHAYNEAMGGDSEEAPPEEEDEGYRMWLKDQEREAEG